MSSPQFEAFLARLYSEQSFLQQFLAAPEHTLAESGLDARERAAAMEMDRVGLQMAARSYEAKRNGRPAKKRRWPFR